MSVKLDSTNFIVWKHQLSSILKAYSMIDYVDGTVPSPTQFLTNADGALTTTVNPEFQLRNTRDQGLLALINSTLSHSVLSMVVGHNSAEEVWKTLEHRFTSTSRANVLNLKIELHNLKKGNESISSYLQKVKNTRDKLVAVGTLIDNEKLLHIILKGLPREYGPFCSAIRTRNELVTFEEIMVLLQTEEHSASESSNSGKDSHPMAMFASAPNNRTSNSQSAFYGNNTQFRGRGRNNSQRGSRPQCQICGKLGHQALDCYHRMDFAYQGRHPPAKLQHHTRGQNKYQWAMVNQFPSTTLEMDLPSRKVLYKGLSKNGLYPIHTLPSSPSMSPSASASPPISAFLSSKNKWQLWYHRLGHPSDRVLVSVIPALSSCISVSNKHVQHHCKHCLIGKMHRLPFTHSQFQSTQPLELVHSDVWGPAPVNSCNGYKYYLLFVDDFSRFSWLFLLKSKSEVLNTFKHFKATVENQLSKSIKFLRTDCGGEYTSNAFTDFCSTQGITHQFSCPHTPQQNGTVERKHRHIIESALTLLSHASLPITHWTYAVTTAIHLINRLPTPKLSHKSPWEKLFHKLPNLTHLRTFGCLCFPYLRPYNHHKLQPRTTPCIFLGYPAHTKGYICLNPATQRTYISKHVLFNETEFLPHLTLSSNTVTQPEPITSQFDSLPWLLVTLHTCPFAYASASVPSASASVPSASASASCPPATIPHPITDFPLLPHITLTPPLSVEHISSFNTPFPTSAVPLAPPIPNLQSPPLPPSPATLNTHPMQTRSKHGIFKPKIYHTISTDYTHIEPPTYQLASKYPQWCTAMDEEFSALQRQHTWSLVPPPIGKNIVGCKWVFKLKRNSDGSISRYKARLVAKGFHQQYGIDFEETFSLVVKPLTVRLILALAVTYNWPLRQLDVRNAFLHGVLKEEVYMMQPPGYVASNQPQHVCKLQKSIYGLKQAPRAWFESFTTQLLSLGFQASSADSSLFTYKAGSVIAFLLLYVDEILLTGNNSSFITQLIHALSKVFELKYMGSLSYFLGLQIQRSTKGLTITQTKYATDLLTKHNMVHCSPCKTPCVPHVRLSAHCGQPIVDVHAYRSLVGALHYLTFTRPDISFAVHQVCQFMNAPSDIHLTAAKRILRYLRGTLDHGLFYTLGPISLSVFSDADWVGDPNDRRSTSGLLVYLGHNPITWSAKKQLTVSRSSTEAEYRALASASAEVCWLHTLVKDLGLYLYDPPVLWCDNVSALAIASNPVFHARTKHIEVDFHFIRERVLRKDLQVKFVSTVDQLADIFTKGLSSHRFQELQSKLLVPEDTICLKGDDEVNDL
uniref:Integrase catalytic domain-containing protein n=1 Tax=Fagus sylvatica TaxID=28930 RepID=A0A2N9J182_FAGSY